MIPAGLRRFVGLRSRDAGLRPRQGPVTIEERLSSTGPHSGLWMLPRGAVLSPACPSSHSPLLLFFLLPSFSSSILHCSSLLSSLPSFLLSLLWSRLPSPQCRPWTGRGRRLGGQGGGATAPSRARRLRVGAGLARLRGPLPLPPPPPAELQSATPMPPEVASAGPGEGGGGGSAGSFSTAASASQPAPRPATGRAQPGRAARGSTGLGRRAGSSAGSLGALLYCSAAGASGGGDGGGRGGGPGMGGCSRRSGPEGRWEEGWRAPGAGLGARTAPRAQPPAPAAAASACGPAQPPAFKAQERRRGGGGMGRGRRKWLRGAWPRRLSPGGVLGMPRSQLLWSSPDRLREWRPQTSQHCAAWEER